ACVDAVPVLKRDSSCHVPCSSRPASGPSWTFPRRPLRVPARESTLSYGERAPTVTISAIPRPAHPSKTPRRSAAPGERPRRRGERGARVLLHHAHPRIHRDPPREGPATERECRIPRSPSEMIWEESWEESAPADLTAPTFFSMVCTS